MNKHCYGCNKTLAASEFYKNCKKADGLQTQCKLCMNKRNKEWQIKNPEKAKLINHKSYVLNKDKVNDKAKLWKKNNPEKAKEIYKKSAEKRRVLFPEKISEINQKSRIANIEKRRAYDRLRYANNAEKRNLYVIKWRKENKGVLNCYSKNRKASLLNAKPKWANMFFIKEAYNLAKLRSEQTGFKWHVDHIVPLRGKTVCGLHVEHNLQVIPAVINLMKHNSYWHQMP